MHAPRVISLVRWLIPLASPAALLQLGNQGDEFLLRDASGIVVDALAYGSGIVPGQPSCPLVISSGRILERNPYWRDTDNCVVDFLNWTLPTPGIIREVAIPPGSDTE